MIEHSKGTQELMERVSNEYSWINWSKKVEKALLDLNPKCETNMSPY